jgi:transposase
MVLANLAVSNECFETILKHSATTCLRTYIYLRDVLTRSPSMTNRQIKDVVPKAWAATQKTAAARKAA